MKQVKHVTVLPAPPEWLVTFCKLHSFSEPKFDLESDTLADEWWFQVRDGRTCCYMATWTMDVFLNSMGPYL